MVDLGMVVEVDRWVKGWGEDCTVYLSGRLNVVRAELDTVEI